MDIELNYQVTERTTVKASAIAFFDQHTQLWSERYSDPANGRSLQERRTAILELIRESGPSKEFRFLDLGCGTGLLSLDIASLGFKGIGIDGAPSMVDYCRKRAELEGFSKLWRYETADVEKTPLQDFSVDFVICCGVIEYLPDDKELFREVKRVLRPGGRFLLCVTNKYSYSGCLAPLFQFNTQYPECDAYDTKASTERLLIQT